MQTGETALEEAPGGHSVPAVIIGVSYYEARKDKEEINRQISVIYYLVPIFGM